LRLFSQEEVGFKLGAFIAYDYILDNELGAYLYGGRSSEYKKNMINI